VKVTTWSNFAPFLAKQAYIRKAKQQTLLCMFTVNLLSISESAIISLITSWIGTVSWHLFQKNHEKICLGLKNLNFCQYCAKQFKFNYLVIRHEKGCRDRPGWINLIVWIDSFFELWCYGAMSTFSLHQLSWWFSISFSNSALKAIWNGLTWATPVTEIGTPWLVITVGDFTTNVMVDKGILWTVWIHGQTKARPPTIRVGSSP
jgi:hypothetical protein